MPPSIVAGDIDALAHHLGQHDTVALMLGGGFGGEISEKEAYDLVTTLQPKTKVVARGNRMVRALLQERAELPVRYAPVPTGGADILGRPTYTWEGVKLRTTWEGLGKELSGATAILAIDDADIEPDRWRRLPQRSVGSCAPLQEAIAINVGHFVSALAPFKEHVDASLLEAHRELAREAIPSLRRDLEGFTAGKQRVDFEDRTSWERYECGVAYNAAAAAYAACADPNKTCAWAPRLDLSGGVRIGAAVDDVYVPSDCAARFGRDIRAELGGLAAAASDAVVAQLDPRWLELASRAAALHELSTAIESVCTPARRRFTPETLNEARALVADVGRQLAEPLGTDAGTWHAQSGRFHVPRVGPLEQLARFEPAAAQPSAKARDSVGALTETLRANTTCRVDRDSLPVVALLADVGSSEVQFFSYFYEEELVCLR